jgi:hypothetical protein
VRYDAYCRVERVRHGSGLPSGRERLRDALTPSLRRAPDWRSSLLRSRRERQTRFFAGAEDQESTRAVFLARFQAERRQAAAEAARALRGEYAFFGGTYRYGAGVDWHADPVTGARWPRVYHRDVPVNGGDVGFGDVKHVWELCRHQFLIDLAKGWAIERDIRCAAAVRDLVRDWRAQNPLGTGVGWACALEPAFRTLSWLWAYFLTLDDPAMDDEHHLEWLAGFEEHGWFLYRHLEYYTSPFNHLAGEACALYTLGLLFPEFADAPRWRQHGRDVLESRLRAQFYEDGGSVEQSTFYHHATTGFYLIAALLGRENGEEFSPAVWGAIARALDFSAALQQPDGTTPAIGGADDGKPIRLEVLPLWDFRPYHAIGAVLFERGDLKAVAGRFFEDALWLLGPSGASRFDALPPHEPRRSCAFPASGYVVLRNSWRADADYLCLDCGEQAGGLRRDGIASAAHGHADCLSIVMWRQGRPVLVDPGFHCYNGPKAWQDHFRETAAHSTVRIDGRDQALHISKMAWAYTYSATLEGCDVSGTGSGWAVASHDGYRGLPGGGIRHRRGVWTRARGYVVVCDVLDGSGVHDVEVTWQFAPGTLDVCGTRARFDSRVVASWFAPIRLAATGLRGGDTPDGGWIAPSLGVKVAAPRLVVAGQLRCPAPVVTIFADTTVDGVAPAVTMNDGALQIAGDGWTDVLVVQGLSEAAPAGLQTDAILAAWRQQDGRLTADGHVGGTFQSAGTGQMRDGRQ